MICRNRIWEELKQAKANIICIQKYTDKRRGYNRAYNGFVAITASAGALGTLLNDKVPFFGKHSVNHVFSSPTSIINFTSKKPSYDDTRRSGRDNELLQRAQNDL